MRRSIDDATDDHPSGDERPPVFWAVGLSDDCEACAGARVIVSLEEVGRPGAGLSAHLEPGSARRLRAALSSALRELGEDAGD